MFNSVPALPSVSPDSQWIGREELFERKREWDPDLKAGMNVPSSAEGWNPSSTAVFLDGLIKRTSFLRVLADLVKQLANLVSDSRNFA
jgi:hypothetical protein